MDKIVPPGFARVDLGEGFSEKLGDVYVNRETRTVRWQVMPEHANPTGACHGGALASFADAQIVASYGDPVGWSAHLPTISLAVDYLAPIPVGAWVEAVVTLDRVTRTMIFSRATFLVDGRTVGRSTAIYRNADRAGEQS